MAGWRYAARTLAKSAGVTATATIALALGIGINTAVFTVVRQALNIDLGVKGIERMLVINMESQNHNETGALLLELRDSATRLKSIDLLAAYRVASMNVSDANHLPERYWGAQMTASGFEILSRQPALGRIFGAADEKPGATAVTVISHRMWQDRFGKDPSAVGRMLRVNDVPRVIIGVMPPGVMVPEDVDLWVPLDPMEPNPTGIVARLAPGMRAAAARAEIESLVRRTVRQIPGSIARVSRRRPSPA